MVYTGPVNPGDPTIQEHEAARAVAESFDDLDDPEYEWAREQMARVGVELPEVRLRPDPGLSQRLWR